jgi:dTDP-4-dehydrorhamnose reductase
VRILVTGAKGQVGSELIQQGKKLGLQMLATDRAELDITQQHQVNRFIRVQQPDIIINAAAYTAVDRAESEPELAYATNRDGAAYLAQACADNHIPLLHLSTDYLFDGNKQGGYSETDLPNPRSIYGKSKLEGERAIESILTQHLILRVSWVFGAKDTNFVKTMLRLGREQDVLKVVADQRGGPTWSGDIAAILLNLVKRWRAGEAIPWGTYHFSGQPATTWHTFAEAIFEQAEILGMLNKQPKVDPITSAEYPTTASRPLNTVFDCHKIAQELGIAQPDWRVGLKDVLIELKAQ